MNDKKVYLNGKIVPAGDAKISIFDQGFLHGASTFTTMLAHNGVVVGFDYHLRRLSETINLLGLRVEATSRELIDATYDVIDANKLKDARVRITLTPGSASDEESTVIVTADQLPDYPASMYEQGIKVVISSFKQALGDPIFGYKTGCYLTRILARKEAAAKGAEDAIWFTTDNRLAEGCFSNIFLVRDGVVYTPPRDTPVLPGFVRHCVIDLCDQLGIECESTKTLTIHDLLGAEEVFFTGSCVGICPIRQIENHAVADENPGEITLKLMIEYKKFLTRTCKTR